MSNVIIIAPHPDDETLGCGGSILKHKSNNDVVSCIFVTNNIGTSYFDERQNEINKVSQSYSFDYVYKLDFCAAKLTSVDLAKMVQDISNIFHERKPDTVYIPFAHDVHSDHRITFEASVACTKSFRYPFIRKILMYETLSETDFSPIAHFAPNYFVDISDFFEQKLEIMKLYKTEVQEGCYPQSLNNIESLARLRGSAICSRYAEAFQLIKLIEKK